MVGGGGRRKEERGKGNKDSHFWRAIFDPSKWPGAHKIEVAGTSLFTGAYPLCLRLSPSVYLSHAHKTLHFYKTYIFQNILKRLVRLQCEFFPELGHRDPETENFCHSITELDPILDHTVPL